MKTISKKEFCKKIGMRLKEHRLANGMTQKQAADYMEFPSYQTIGCIEKGKRVVKTWELNLFSRIYNFDSNIFLRELDKPIDMPTMIWRNKK